MGEQLPELTAAEKEALSDASLYIKALQIMNDLLAENERLKEVLGIVHDWFLKQAPEHYKGTGAYLDVQTLLGREAKE